MQQIALWLATLVAVWVVLRVAKPIFRRWWPVVWPTRASALTVVIGFILLFVTEQGRELAVGLAGASWWVLLLFVLGVLYWALQAWYWARVVLDQRFGADRAGWKEQADMIRVVPRAYGVLVHLEAAGSVALAIERGAGFDARLVTALALIALSLAFFVMFVLTRIDMAERLLRRLVVHSGHTYGLARLMRPIEGRSRLRLMLTPEESPLANIILILSVGVFVFWFFQAGWHPVEWGERMGAAPLAFGALGTWVSVGTIMVMIAHRTGFPVLLGLLLVSLIVGLGKENNLVRTLPQTEASIGLRPDLEQAVQDWHGRVAAKDSGQPIPAIFVATAGGGLRAAYWTATVLGTLDDTHPGFRDHLVAVSGVSGGSLGAVVYQALVKAAEEGEAPPNGIAAAGQTLLSRDFLAPTLAAMVYTDVPGSVLPDPVTTGLFQLGGRATALENAWMIAWRDVPGYAVGPNPLDQPFLDLGSRPGDPEWRPILLLNSTHEERGKRVITSTIRVLTHPFTDAWDMHLLLGRDMWATTAAHNSARFSYVSPAGEIEGSDGKLAGHVLDGGYFENYGAVTLLEAAQDTVDTLHDPRIRPIIIQISSDPALLPRDRPRSDEHGCDPGRGFLHFDPSHDTDWGLANEALAPVGGIFQTREARGVLASKEMAHWADCWSLERKTDEQPAVFVHLGMCADGEAPPLGWVMADSSRNYIKALIKPDGCNAAALKTLAEALAPLGAVAQR